jgi:hypothetical protein
VKVISIGVMEAISDRLESEDADVEDANDALKAIPASLTIIKAAIEWRDAEPRTAEFDEAAQALRVALRKVTP